MARYEAWQKLREKARENANGKLPPGFEEDVPEPPPPPPRAAAAALSLLGHGRILEMMLPAARRDSVQQQAMFASVDAACRVGTAARILLGGSGVGGGGGKAARNV